MSSGLLFTRLAWNAFIQGPTKQLQTLYKMTWKCLVDVVDNILTIKVFGKNHFEGASLLGP